MDQFVILEHARHAVARTLAPQRDDDLLADALQFADMRDDFLEDVDRGVGALGREVAPGPRPGVDHASNVVWHRKRCQSRQRDIAQRVIPFILRQV
jgi:hypothetical protein